MKKFEADLELCVICNFRPRFRIAFASQSSSIQQNATASYKNSDSYIFNSIKKSQHACGRGTITSCYELTTMHRYPLIRYKRTLWGGRCFKDTADTGNMARFIIFATLLTAQFAVGLSGKSTDLWFFPGPTLSLSERSYPPFIPAPLEASLCFAPDLLLSSFDVKQLNPAGKCVPRSPFDSFADQPRPDFTH